MRAFERSDPGYWDERLRIYFDRGGVYILAAIVFFEAIVIYRCLGYNNFYDEGVYLESARMMFRGHQLYTTIFDSQPPLWIPIIYSSFCIAGIDSTSAQWAIGIAALVAVIATALATRQLAGWGAATLAAGALVCSPMEVWIPRVLPAIPSIALSTAAVAFAILYARRGSLVWLCAAGILVASAILVKLLGVFTLPGVILMAAVRCSKADATRWQKCKLFLRDTLIVLGIAAVLTIVLFAEFGPTNVWREAVNFHWIARSTMRVDSFHHQWQSVKWAIKSDRLPFALALLAILSVYAGGEGLVLIAWIFSSSIGLIFHQPLYSHHVIILIPPVAIAGAVGWNYIPSASNRLHSLFGGAITAQITGALILLADITLIVVLLSAFAVRGAAVADRAPVYHADIAAARLIQQLTTPSETILTDAQGIAFLADRDVPAELTDTSFKRIATGYLTLNDVIAYSHRENVHLILLWSGRLKSLPGMTQWLAAHFPYHRNLGENRDLYTLRPQMPDEASPIATTAR